MWKQHFPLENTVDIFESVVAWEKMGTSSHARLPWQSSRQTAEDMLLSAACLLRSKVAAAHKKAYSPCCN